MSRNSRKHTESFTDGNKLAAALCSHDAVQGLQCHHPPHTPPPLPKKPPAPRAQRRLWNQAIKSESVVQHGRKKTPWGGRYAGLLLQFSTVTDGEGRDVEQNDAFGLFPTKKEKKRRKKWRVFIVQKSCSAQLCQKRSRATENRLNFR